MGGEIAYVYFYLSVTVIFIPRIEKKFGFIALGARFEILFLF